MLLRPSNLTIPCECTALSVSLLHSLDFLGVKWEVSRRVFQCCNCKGVRGALPLSSDPVLCGALGSVSAIASSFPGTTGTASALNEGAGCGEDVPTLSCKPRMSSSKRSATPLPKPYPPLAVADLCQGHGPRCKGKYPSFSRRLVLKEYGIETERAGICRNCCALHWVVVAETAV